MANMYCNKEKAHAATVKRVKEGILSSSEVEKVCSVFRLLADPTRMKAVLALMKGEMCVYHLAEVTDSTVSGVSHQLRLLREKGIVKAERFGKNVEYSIIDEHVRKIVQTAIKHLSCEMEGNHEKDS